MSGTFPKVFFKAAIPKGIFPTRQVLKSVLAAVFGP